MTAPSPSRRGPHSQRRAAARARLIDLGLERFPLKGYVATTIEDIVADSGLSRATWYYYFGDKDEFFLELLRARRSQRQTWWKIADDPAIATIEDAISAAMEVFARVDRGYVPWILMQIEFWQAHRDEPERLRILEENYTMAVDDLSEFVERLRTRGLVTSSKPSPQLAAAMLSLYDGALTKGVVHHAPGPIVDGDMLAAILRAR